MQILVNSNHTVNGTEALTERVESIVENAVAHFADRITRIEVIRIRPQAFAGEPVGDLIEDPWRTLPCVHDPAGCTVDF